MPASIDRKTYGLAVAAAALLLLGGAWPRAQHPKADHDGDPRYFWRDVQGRAAITPATAIAQTPRVARRRGLAEQRLGVLITRSTHNDTYNFSARPQVDVDELNLRIDGQLQ